MTRVILTAILSAAFSAHAAFTPLPATARVELPALDRAKLAIEDSVTDKKVGPFRYGVAVPLSESQSKTLSVNNGQWQKLKSGEMLWHGEVFAKGASTVDVLLKPFWLPQNAKLTIFDGTGKQIWGPFGHEQNNLANTLPLPMVAGETMRIAVTVPADEQRYVQLAVSLVKQGYRGFESVNGRLVSKAGGCNVDVVCPIGDLYRDQARGVVAITLNSVEKCTGTLINNTRGDRTALLLTARHCGITAANASGVTVYYNYQSSTCRPLSTGSISSPELPGNYPVQMGATLVATSGKSDFALLRLNGTVPSAASPYWLGWDRRDLGLSGATVIHHPNVEEKRISIENESVLISSIPRPISNINPTLGAFTTLIVEDWDVGTTEPGSSGAVLLNRESRRIVGTLSGGSAKCEGLANVDEDIFGRLFTGWEGENTPATRLKDHLDPLGTAPQVLDGTNLCNAPSVSLNVNIASPSSRDDVTYTANVSGGVAPYSYAWDIDGDGVTDRTSSSNVITTRYDRARSIDVRVSVTDTSGCSAVVTRAMSIIAPNLRIDSLTASTQLCGDGDSVFDPGERWRINANVKNSSSPALGAFAQFAPGTSGLAAADAFGYRFSDSASICPADTYIDISNEMPLQLTQANQFGALDDGRTSNIALDSNAFEYYGELANSVAMSTNGYLIINPTSAMRGGDYQPNCGNIPTENLDLGRRIRILHRDLNATALRSSTRAICPRPSTVGAAIQPCVIFDWAGMRFVNGSQLTGNFDMQVLLYPQTKQLVYQFRGDLPANDVDLAVSGLMNTTTSAYNYMCLAGGPPRVTAGKSVCYFHPSAQPTVSPLVVTQGAGVLGSIASGQIISTSADIKIPADAACGSTLRLNYVTGIDDRAVTSAAVAIATNELNVTISSTCNVVNNCPLPAQIAMRGGSFFNPARGGNGLVAFLIARAAPQVPLFFGAWFTGEPNRNLTWYIVTGDLLGNQVNAQILQTKRNVASPTFTTTNTEVGKAQISLVSPEQFLFSYQFTGGSNAGRSGGEIMQHLFAGLSPAVPNITGHYFNPAESGWGQTYESYVQGGVAQQFILTYLYDAAGEPRWVLGSFPDNLASGPANTYEVHCPGCAWLEITPTTKSAGTQSRMFPNGFGNAIIGTQFVLPAPLSGNWIKNSVTVTPLSDRPQ